MKFTYNDGLIDKITEAVTSYVGNDFFEIEVVDSDNNPIEDYIERVLQDKKGQKKVSSLLKKIIETKGSIWEDDETPLGLWFAVKLARVSEKYLPIFTRYILSTNLDHEVYQTQEAMKIIELYGWKKSTYKLFTELLFTSMHAPEYLWDFNDLLQKLGSKKSEEKLFFKLLQKAENYDHQYIDGWKEKYDREYRFKIKGEVDIESLLKPHLNNRDFDKIKEIMAEHQSQMGNITLWDIIRPLEYFNEEFAKNLIQYYGADRILNETKDRYLTLNYLYENYKLNKEAITYLYDAGVLAYKRENPMEPLGSSRYDDHPIAYLLSSSNNWRDESKKENTLTILNELIDRGCDIDEIFTHDGKIYNFVLGQALDELEPCYEAVEILLERGAEVNYNIDKVRDDGSLKSRKSLLEVVIGEADYSYSDLDTSTRSVKKRAKSDRIFELVKRMVEMGAEYEPINPGYDIFPTILLTNHLEMTKYFYDKGCFDIKGKPWDQNIPYIFKACGTNEMLKWALDMGGDINAVDHRGYSLLMRMIDRFDLEGAKLLFDNNIDPDIVNNKGESARDMLINKYNKTPETPEFYADRRKSLKAIADLFSWEI